MARGIAIRSRVRYSAEGVRVLCKPGDKLADKPDRVGVFLGMVTEKVGRVLWDDRRSPQYLHIDFIESLPADVSPDAANSSLGAGNSAADASIPASVASFSSEAC